MNDEENRLSKIVEGAVASSGSVVPSGDGREQDGRRTITRVESVSISGEQCFDYRKETITIVVARWTPTTPVVFPEEPERPADPPPPPPPDDEEDEEDDWYDEEDDR